jgi:membrane-associated phospholipid phosphatase
VSTESSPPAPVDEVVDPNAPVADAAHDSAAVRRARRRAGALAAALLCIAVVATASILIDPVAPWFQPFDDSVSEWAEEHRYAPFVRLAEWLDVAGSVVVTVPLRLLAVAVLLMRRRWTQLAIFVTAVVLSELCIGPLKAWTDRARPPGRIIETSSASFPSGHSIAAAVTAFGLVVAFLPRGRRRVHWGIVATFVAASMAWSRVYLGAHWATDTIAGICFGVGIAVGTEVLLEGTRTSVAEHAEAEEHTVLSDP